MRTQGYEDSSVTFGSHFPNKNFPPFLTFPNRKREGTEKERVVPKRRRPRRGPQCDELMSWVHRVRWITDVENKSHEYHNATFLTKIWRPAHSTFFRCGKRVTQFAVLSIVLFLYEIMICGWSTARQVVRRPNISNHLLYVGLNNRCIELIVSLCKAV